MDFIDYYKILEIDKKASEADVKKSYRRLARKLHPDLNPNDREANKKFQVINEANDVLSDPDKRKKYDQYGKNWQHADQFDQQEQQRQSNQYTQHFTSEDEADYSSFFESMFSGSERRSQTQYRGKDYNSEFTLSLIDAMETHQQTLTVNGKNIRITIPAGIENGHVIKLKYHGYEGANGGPAGDLYIKFMISPNPNFKRLGNDLFTIANIDLYLAMLGGETTIDTMNGKVKLKVKPETQNGTRVRLKGKGFPIYKKEGEAGDLNVTYAIKLPTKLTEQQKTLFTELSKLN